MNPVNKRSDRTLNRTNTSLSIVPRWSHSKISSDLSTMSKSSTPTFMMKANNKDSSANFTSSVSLVSKRPSSVCSNNQESTTIYEPPALQEKALRAVWKAKQDRQRVNDRIKESASHADFLKQELKEAKEKIERISRELEASRQMPDAMSACDLVNPPAPEMCNHQEQLQQELLKAVNEKDDLEKDLANAHRQLWEARLVDNSLSVEVEQQLNPLIEAYETREEFMMQKRNLRQHFIKQNAQIRQTKSFQMFQQSLLESKESQMRMKNQIAYNIQSAMDARKRLEPYLKRSMQIQKQEKLIQETNQKLKQDRQTKSLSRLQAEISKQRHALALQNQARKDRLKMIEEEKEKIRQVFIRDGKNPYLVDHLLVIEERRAQAQRRILQQETERLIQLQKEYEAMERDNRRAELHKAKWDKFWAKKFEEKKRERIKKETLFFLQDEFNFIFGKNNISAYTADKDSLAEYFSDTCSIDINKHKKTTSFRKHASNK